tara:strand:+ start:1286 stop:1684 length:399 start_codon:yes stop_codon:yes gene_type:complete
MESPTNIIRTPLLPFELCCQICNEDDEDTNCYNCSRYLCYSPKCCYAFEVSKYTQIHICIICYEKIYKKLISDEEHKENNETINEQTIINNDEHIGPDDGSDVDSYVEYYSINNGVDDIDDLSSDFSDTQEV